MFTPNELEGIPQSLEKLFRDLENRIMLDIVRRIKINSQITRSADWQIKRLSELGKSTQEIKSYIKDTLKLSEKEIDRLFSDVIESGYSHDKELYKNLVDIIPFAENKELQQLITAIKEQTKDELFNITQSLGFAVKKDGKIVFKPIAKYYQNTLDNAISNILSGAFSYDTVLKRTVSEMTNSGLRTVDYASGWSNRVTVATRRAVMTGFTQVTAKINEDNAKTLGTDYFEITYHTGARPSHQIWQGKVFSKAELETVCGLGTVTGLCGANCYHSYFPFIPGISKRTYTDEQLRKLHIEENTPKTYGGKKYTAYQASQRQRSLETLMRKQRQDIKLLQEGGASEDEIINARCRYRKTSAIYKDFSEKMNLPQQRQRVAIDGLGNIGVGKINDSFSSLTKITADGGIKIKETSKHFKDRVKERGISIDSIKNALTTPLKKGKIRADRTQQFIGEKATVAINVDTGKITTVWQTSSKKVEKLKRGSQY